MFSKKSNFLTPAQQSSIEFFMNKNRQRKSRKTHVSRSLKRIQTSVVSTVEATQQSFVITDTGFSNGTSTGNSLNFNFTQISANYNLAGAGLTTLTAYSNASAYAQIYDQYRILKVELDIYYSANSNTNNSSSTLTNLSLPIMYGVVDYDDSLPLTSENAALSYSTCQTYQLGNSSGTNNGRQRKNLQKPTALGISQIQGGTVPGLLNVSPWLNADDQSVTHYGLKFYISSSLPTPIVATNLGYVTFIIRQFVEYRNIR